jgi:hypothetical protein
MTTNTTKSTARMAGFLYLLLAITAAFGIMYAPSQVFVRNDINATWQNLITENFMHRMGIAAHLTSQVLFVFLGSYLYRLFYDVDKQQAKLMFGLILVQIPVVFVLETLNLSAAMIAEGKILTGIATPQEFAYALIRIHDYGINILGAFYGLWLLPLGRLFIKSSSQPNWIGGLLIAACITYLIDSLLFILFPDIRKIFNGYAMMIPTVAELATVFWLLIKGEKEG